MRTYIIYIYVILVCWGVWLSIFILFFLGKLSSASTTKKDKKFMDNVPIVSWKKVPPNLIILQSQFFLKP